MLVTYMTEFGGCTLSRQFRDAIPSKTLMSTYLVIRELENHGQGSVTLKLSSSTRYHDGLISFSNYIFLVCASL